MIYSLLKAVIFEIDSALQIMSHTSTHGVRSETLHKVLCIVLQFLDYKQLRSQSVTLLVCHVIVGFTKDKTI